MRRLLLLHVAPVLGLLLILLIPQIRGSETLYFRDVLQAHLGVKTAQTEAWRAGYVPEIDVYRAGGQPLAGNPNSVPFYPDNLLYLVAPVLWALNAHFWIHLLLAPLAAYWLGRAWGLSREGSWAVGVCYGFSGYLLSHLTFYNLIAGVALAPALVAACLRVQEAWRAPAEREGARDGAGEAGRDSLREDGRELLGKGGLLVATAVLWALQVLAGDPFMAVLTFGLAAAAVWVRAATLRPRRLLRRVPVLPLAAAFAAGTLLAAPQWVEFLRILPLSFRGHYGFGGEAGVVESFDPHQMLEWWLPLFFGRPDRFELASFWAWDYYDGFPPYYFSLFPGLLAWVLLAASGRPRRARSWWAWGSVFGGVFLALGGFNPAVSWIFQGGLLRFPIKCWLPVALGASLLCGIGYQRTFSEQRVGEDQRRGFRWALGGLVVLYAASFGALLLLRANPAAPDLLRILIRERYSDAFVTNELLRWSGLAFLCLLVLLAMALVFRGLRRHPGPAGALLLLLHAGSQLFFLAPLRDTDSVLPYVTPPPALAHVPRDGRVADGSYLLLFGEKASEIVPLPGPESRWYFRRRFFELTPATGPQWGRRYELNVSPEGLDGFVTEIARSAMVYATADDLERVRMLRAWGVSTLLLGRELEPAALRWTTGAWESPAYGAPRWIYRLADPAPDVLFTGQVIEVSTVNETVEVLQSPRFDPLRMVTVPTEEAEERESGEAGRRRAADAVDGADGIARLVSRGPESLEIEVDAHTDGVLAVQRSHLELWRASVTGETAEGERPDGKEVPILAANIQRMGVELSPGRYRVRFWIDRRPLALAGALAVLGLLALVGLGWLPRLAERRAAAGPPPDHPAGRREPAPG